MRNSEDIMADYLLKGAKMLGKTCSVCGSPLFCVHGETYCVVCKENGNENKTESTVQVSKVSEKIGTSPATAAYEAEQNNSTCGCNSGSDNSGKTADPDLCIALESALGVLCRRITPETRPKDCVNIMKAIGIGVDLLKKLR